MVAAALALSIVSVTAVPGRLQRRAGVVGDAVGRVDEVGADGGLEPPGIDEGAAVDRGGLQVEDRVGVDLDGAAAVGDGVVDQEQLALAGRQQLALVGERRGVGVVDGQRDAGGAPVDSSVAPVLLVMAAASMVLLPAVASSRPELVTVPLSISLEVSSSVDW